ncbi:hypothetical protein [Photobacterium leiognathi]|uniref:hypothetical protein n=1 Tax=Photobacterium leiognathi TaxID=553611 RepID=UPI00298296AE|nr:hypothetical protein [Photobacterium leiognathi]
MSKKEHGTDTEMELRNALIYLVEQGKSISVRAVEKHAGKGNGLISKKYPDLLTEIQQAKVTRANNDAEQSELQLNKIKKLRKQLRDEREQHKKTKEQRNNFKHSIEMLATQVAELTLELHRLKSDESKVGSQAVSQLFSNDV